MELWEPGEYDQLKKEKFLVNAWENKTMNFEVKLPQGLNDRKKEKLTFLFPPDRIFLSPTIPKLFSFLKSVH